MTIFLIIVIVIEAILIFFLWRDFQDTSQTLDTLKSQNEPQYDYNDNLIQESSPNEIEILPIEDGEISIGDDGDPFISEESFKNFFEEADKITIQEMDLTSTYQRILLCKFLAACAKSRDERKIRVDLLTSDEVNTDWLYDNLREDCKQYGIILNPNMSRALKQRSYIHFEIDGETWKVYSSNGLDMYNIDDDSLLSLYEQSLVGNRYGTIKIMH